MKSFRCGDLLPGCAATFAGSTEEILAAISGHARDAHGIWEVTPALAEAVQRGMTTVV